MRELVEDKIYEILNNKYDELLLDYVLLSFWIYVNTLDTKS